MSETDSIACLATQSREATTEQSPATQRSQNMFFSKQSNSNSQQIIVQTKRAIPQTDKVKQLYLFPPSSQMLSSMSTSSSSSVASGSSKAQPGGLILSNSQRNVQPSTKKYKVKINSGKGTIPGDFFSQFYDSVLSKRAMTAVEKQRKIKEIDETRPMSQMVESRNHDGRIGRVNNEMKENTNIKQNNQQITQNNKNNNNSNLTDHKTIQHNTVSASQKESTEKNFSQPKSWDNQKQTDMFLNEENLMTFSSPFPIFSVQDTPKFNSGTETSETQFFPLKNNININQPLSKKASDDNSIRLFGKSNMEKEDNIDKLTAPAASIEGISCQRAPPPSEDQSEAHMSFSDCLVIENNNNNNNNQDCQIDSRIISQKQSDKQTKITSNISNIEEPSNKNQEFQMKFQKNQNQQEEMTPSDVQPILQLKLRRCASMETEINFQKQEFLTLPKKNEQTLLQHCQIKSNNLAYQDNFQDTERESLQNISQQINIEGNNKSQPQQQVTLNPSSSDKNPSKSKGFTLKTPSNTSSLKFNNKHSSTHQFANNDNFNHSVELQALKEVYRQQSLVKQQDIIAKLVTQDYLQQQQQGQGQQLQHKKLNKQESVPNLQIHSTEEQEEENHQLSQIKPKQYYLGMNQQRSSSTGEISGGSISYFLKSRTRIPEHKKNGSQVDGISTIEASTKMSFIQKPVRVIASSSTKRIKDIQEQQSPSNKQKFPQQRKSQEITLTSQEQILTQKQSYDDTDSFVNLISKVKIEQNIEKNDNQPYPLQQKQFQKLSKQEQQIQSKSKTNQDSQGKKSKWLSENTVSFYNIGGSIVSPEKTALTERLSSLDQNQSCGIQKNKQQNTTVQSGISWNVLNNSEDIMNAGNNNYFHMRSSSKNQVALANYCQQSTNSKNGFPQILTNQQVTKNKSNYQNSHTETDRQCQISMTQQQQQIQNSLCLQKSQLNNMDNSKYFNMKKLESQEQLQQKMSSSQSKLRLQSPERTSSKEHNRKIISTLAYPKPLQGVLSKLIFPERERAQGTHFAGCLTSRTPTNRQTYLNMK